MTPGIYLTFTPQILMTQKLKGCLMSWFNQTANISLLHSYPAITPPSLSPSHSCFLVCVCVCHGERENGEKSKEVEKKDMARGHRQALLRNDN